MILSEDDDNDGDVIFKMYHLHVYVLQLLEAQELLPPTLGLIIHTL